MVAAPRYFSGTLELGGLTQTADAFGQVQGSMSWFINSVYAMLARWRAIVRTADHVPPRHRRGARRRREVGILRSPAAGDAVQLRDVTMALPDGATLLEDADMTFKPGRSVVVSGRSGSGKSTLFRAIAGIWPFGSGTVQRPTERAACSCRSAPYIPLGHLRHVVCYPAPPDTYDRRRSRQALADAGLSDLVARSGHRRGLGAAPVGRRAAAHRPGARAAGEAGLAVPGRGHRQPRSGGRSRAVSHAEASACRRPRSSRSRTGRGSRRSTTSG